MDMANYIAWCLGRLDEAGYRRMRLPLRANYRGFADYPIPMQPFLDALSKDKKNIGTQLVLILPNAEGRIEKGRYDNDEPFRNHCADFLEKQRQQ